MRTNLKNKDEIILNKKMLHRAEVLEEYTKRITLQKSVYDLNEWINELGDELADENCIVRAARKSAKKAAALLAAEEAAAAAVGLVVPELAGKFDGLAVRVPTVNVSLVDLSFIASRDTTVEEVNAIIESAASLSPMSEVLAVNKEPLVSIDYNHQPASSTVDSLLTKVQDGNLIKVISWYDNEWGFSNRMLDTTIALISA